MPSLSHKHHFSRRHLAFVPYSILFLLCVLFASCSNTDSALDWESVESTIATEFPDIRQMTTDDLANILDDDAKEVMLLDVREDDEVAVSHLLGAVRVGSVQEAATLIQSAPQHTIIVAYCSVGYRSAELVSDLQQLSTRTVYNLNGSLFRWANEDRAVYRGTERVTTVHPFNEHWGTLLDTSLHAYEPSLPINH
ncbi:MAG: rhodanese-like domain-containing protein [Vicinamibacterales bacterium]